MQNLFDKLSENMQVIYRKAIDADQALDQLQASGKGKFNLIFAEDAGFTARSKRFSPYVEELGKQVAGLNDASEADIKAALPDVVKKMELMLSTLSHFQASLK